MKVRTLQSIAVLGLVIACLAGPSFGSVIASSPNFPPFNGWFESTSVWSAYFADGVIIANAGIKQCSQNQPPPAPGISATQSLDATVYGLMSVDGGNNFQPFAGPANITVRLDSGIDTAVTRNFTGELLQMDVSTVTPWGPATLRESPTLQSTGQMSMTDLGGGNYSFDSFFDVFTELSLDGGASWYPTLAGADHQVLIPEPATMSLLALGGVAMLRRRRTA